MGSELSARSSGSGKQCARVQRTAPLAACPDATLSYPREGASSGAGWWLSGLPDWAQGGAGGALGDLWWRNRSACAFHHWFWRVQGLWRVGVGRNWYPVLLVFNPTPFCGSLCGQAIGGYLAYHHPNGDATWLYPRKTGLA